jgi:hypothetical protein
VRTDEQWRDQLLAALAERWPRLDLWSRYYKGDHRLQFATSKFREAFGEMLEEFATNWCALVVDVCAERLAVQGFNFGGDDSDDDAWAIWQANNLDAGSLTLHTEAIKNETAYLIVGPPQEDGGQPTITVESPYQVICAHDPADRRRRLAALKLYVDIDGSSVAVLYLPDRIVTWKKDLIAERVESFGVVLPVGSGGLWLKQSEDGNPIGIVPVVPFENSPDLLEGGKSDLAPAVALNDAANKFFMDMLVASEYAGFPQRVVTGVDLSAAKNPDGSMKTEAEIQAAMSRFWAFEDPNAKVHSLPEAQLGGYVQALDTAIQHLAAQTRTPPHYLLAKLINVSADALVAAEAGLEHRAKRKHLDFSESHEEAMRIAFRWKFIASNDQADLARSKKGDAQTMWAATGQRDPLSLASSLQLKQQIGVPEKKLWQEAGYTPQEIKVMLKEKADQKAEEQAQLDRQAAQEREHQLALAKAQAQNQPQQRPTDPRAQRRPAPPARRAA